MCIKNWSAPGSYDSHVIQINVSFGMVGMCGIVAIIWAYFFWDGDLLNLFYGFITFNLITLFFYIPAHVAHGKFQLSVESYWYTILGAAMNIGLLVVGIIYTFGHRKIWQLIPFQVYYSFFTASFVDLVISYTRGIEEYRKPAYESRLMDSSRLIRPRINCTCPICMKEYNDSVIPRFLIQCGHTVCQGCAQNLEGNTSTIVCPNCRQVTIVDESVESLPKNFALLDAMRGDGSV